MLFAMLTLLINISTEVFECDKKIISFETHLSNKMTYGPKTIVNGYIAKSKVSDEMRS